MIGFVLALGQVVSPPKSKEHFARCGDEIGVRVDHMDDFPPVSALYKVRERLHVTLTASLSTDHRAECV